MSKTLSRKKTDQMMDIAQLYVEQGGEEPIDLAKLAIFAINNDHWEKKDLSSLRMQICKREFSRAFREQYHQDPQGRSARTYHAVSHSDNESGQQTFWDDMRRAPAEHMEAAFQQRRSQIVGDCTQLSTDVESWNDNNTVGGGFQLLLDFTDDVAERSQPTEYDPKRPR